ncbi:GntP family permease [Fictibacillus norfolkensis]|uniref:2-keto-3-deoxygluconate permease n=1 Tax=Fictibacillus norfolkensis TaxID=2762233 RepID=A0ABR8SSB1_9BACL|nr:gluconate:H+ symporter [Fictibacillus norfolkensis]MBD7966393.1 2-keto-3-deoxygluconate permease [Fictibacillus norfolkensis]
MDIYLLLVTLAAIAIVIVTVSWLKWHAFISLTVASLFLGLMAGLSLDKIVTAYETGIGEVLGHLVGILALGTILGKMLSESGAGLQIGNFFVRIIGEKRLPWAMLLSGFIIGIPVFFEVGILILLPLVISLHKTTKQNILLIALPVIASLSIVDGLVPPRPGALAAISIYDANLGKVLLYSLVLAFIAAVIAGPLYAKWVHKRVVPENEPELIRIDTTAEELPSSRASFFIILLPVILMILASLAPYVQLPGSLQKFFALIGNPVIALLIAVFAAYYFLGFRKGMDRELIKKFTEESLLPVGSIVLIIGAGGGFKQILIDSGVGETMGSLSENLSLSPLVMAFVIACLIRIATGSATVALTTAAGIVSPIIEHMSGVNLELLVISTAAGSMMFSHVNDPGFWMVKEYLGLTVTETFKTLTVLETILSLTAFAGVLLLNIFL